MQIPPYGLKQRRRPQFRMFMLCSDLLDLPEPFMPEVMPPPPWLPASQTSPKGRTPVRIVGQHACKIACPYLFPPLRNP